MDLRLDHIAIQCKDLDESLRYYKDLFGAAPTDVRKGGAGYRFCFVMIAGAPSVQLMESDGGSGVHHYGFTTSDVESAARDLRQKGAKIIRENRNPSGKLTTIFLEDPNGLEIEIRLPR